MATTMHRQSRRPDWCNRPGTGARQALALAALLACAGPAAAERWAVEANVGSQITRTSNALLEQAGPEAADTVFALTTGIALRGEGARLKLGGTAGLTAVTYADHTLDKRILPYADLNARLEAIERLVYLEAGYRAAQTSADPFGARPEATSALDNVRTTSQWRFSPSLESAFGNNLRYRVRSDNTWTREINTETSSQASDAGGYFGHHTASIERDPVPFGWRIEAERTETRYDNSSVSDPLESEFVRVGARYLIGPDLVVGLRVGSERNAFLPLDERRTTYGVDAQWRPSERTALIAAVDDRFFGTGWDVKFTHRQPRWALDVMLSRAIDTTPQSVFLLPASNNVAGLLDAMFTTRFPDALQRLRVVQDYMAQQGLPGSTLNPTVLYAQRLSVVTAQRVNLAFTGLRSSVAISGFVVRTRDALDSGPLALGLASNNNTQYGGAIAFGHRLTALISFSAGIDWSSIQALETVSNADTKQRSARVQLNALLAPKTNAYVGARYRQLDSNVVNDGNERAIFIGADHRF